ncbi:glycosyltransferase family 4 protein [Methylotuvimicrobium sp. KM1]|uniref:MraY family glycosyltransferase n=1 Tax=Methylotuvimicrobium sp. KM1 TaxID=3377707 RepID=UPI00384D0D33
MVITLALCAFVFALSYWLTGWFRRYALTKSLLDVPNARSSHVVPTPRGGGLPIVLAFLSAVGALSFFDIIKLDNIYVAALIFPGVLVAGIGFWDDHRSIPAKWRFLVHLIAVAGALLILPELPAFRIFSIVVSGGLLLFCLYAVMLVWLLNLYNFMDGIDGIAGVEAMTTAVSAALLLLIQDQHDWALLMLLLAVSAGGFLVWNWPPAKIFMGDACSGFLGFVLGLLAVLTSSSGAMNLWSWWILLAVFIVDATVTLLRRIMRGEAWHQAHRSHAYQILSRHLNSHKKVTQGVLTVNVFWLLPWAYVSVMYQTWAPLICFVAMAPLCVAVLKLGAGTTND